MEILIVGNGCMKCMKLEGYARKAVADLKIAATITHVYDVEKFSDYGVMLTPALVIDGKIQVQGKVVSDDEIKRIIKNLAS